METAFIIFVQDARNKKDMDDLSIYTKFGSLPSELKDEVNDFIDFLILKSTKTKGKGKGIPIFGSAKGKIKMTADFDAPLDDFKDYM